MLTRQNDHPIKTIMDLSCLLRRAMEQEMEESQDFRPFRAGFWDFSGTRPEIIMKRHFRKSWNPNSRFAGLP